MHRSVRVAQIGALALLLLLCAGSLGCKEEGSGSATIVRCKPGSGGPGASTNAIDVSGGNALSTGGTGGMAGAIGFAIWFGGAGSIEVSESGSVDASFTPTTTFAPDLGSNALVVTGDLSIPVVTSAPALDVPYTLEEDSNLYVSDGDMDLGDETPVTGMQVQAGATLTLGLNLNVTNGGWPTGGLTFSHDVVNDGTITVVDADSEQRGYIDLYTDGDYIGSGRIETYGTLPGQSGGSIEVGVLGNGYNSGDWLSYGADQTDDRGGDGGGIYFYTGFYNYEEDFEGEPGGLIENTGDMNANGGTASGATGLGGSGGEIAILPYGSLCNSGDLASSGGNGVGEGGDGGIIQVAGYYRGELRNSGDLTTDGGDASEDESFSYPGDGGWIILGAAGGDLRSSGVVLARAGDSSSDSDTEFDGLGGEISFYTESSVDDYEERELDVPAGDIWVSGGAIATGGEALGSDGQATAGGYVFFDIFNDVTAGAQAIHVLGIDGLYARGGDGEAAGGDVSEGIYFDLAIGLGTATGSVNVEPPMDSSGGDADPGVTGSQGGDAGVIEIIAGTISYGTATAAGGNGETPGADGTITPETGAP